MLKKTITYTDLFDSEKKVTDDFYFNLTKADIAEMQLSVKGGYAEMLMAVAESADYTGYIAVIKDLVDKSYGVRSGNKFIKSKEELDAFKGTDAYSELLLELMDPEKATEFIRGVMPWTSEAQARFEHEMAKYEVR